MNININNTVLLINTGNNTNSELHLNVNHSTVLNYKKYQWFTKILFITLHAKLSSAMYCNWSCLWVCLFVWVFVGLLQR